MKRLLKKITILLSIIVITGIFTECGNQQVKTDTQITKEEEKKDDDKIYMADGTVMTKEEYEKAKEKWDKEVQEKKEKEPDGITLTSGNYVVGVDIEPGTYDIIAIDDDGIVRTDDYKINNLFGVDESKRDVGYLKDFKNAKLEEGQTLKVDGVTIKLVSKDNK